MRCGSPMTAGATGAYPRSAEGRGPGAYPPSPAGVPGSGRKSPAAIRSPRSRVNSSPSSGESYPAIPNRAAIRSAVERVTTSRPPGVISASVPRPSRGLGRRRTRPSRSSRSTVLVTLVGCTMSRSPITRSGSAPVRLNASSTSASYLAKVSRYGRSSPSSPVRSICCARMIEVTAAIASAGPNLSAQIPAARSIGSNGRSSGFATRHTLPLRQVRARLPDMDWSLLGCGASGHVTFAPDEPALRERLSTTAREGPAWRCLRCGTFVIGEPTASGPAEGAPQVRRADQVRSALILRIFAVERFLRALVFAALAIAVWRFAVSRLSLEQAYNEALSPLKALLRDFGFSVQHSRLLGLLHEAFTANSRTLGYIAIGLAAYAVIEVIEGVGLWLVKRWGEYFAMIVTSLGLPYEIYDLSNKVTVLRVVAFVINLGLVLYLVLTKRLFGVRGGKEAYEAHLRSESIMDAEIAVLAAEQEVAVEQEVASEGAAPGIPVPPPETPAATGPPWPDAETQATAGPPWPDAETPATAGPPGPDAETQATTWPPPPDGEAQAAAAPTGTEGTATPTAPGTREAPDAGEADVSAPPPLPRRHPTS